jgi:hypothetical protein
VARITSLCRAAIGLDWKDEARLETRPCPRLILSELAIVIVLLNELILPDLMEKSPFSKKKVGDAKKATAVRSSIDSMGFIETAAANPTKRHGGMW